MKTKIDIGESEQFIRRIAVMTGSAAKEGHNHIRIKISDIEYFTDYLRRIYCAGVIDSCNDCNIEDGAREFVREFNEKYNEQA